MQEKLRILTLLPSRSIRPALLFPKELARGQRHQEATKEDAQAQEEEAAEALASQA